jgi:hypothetical protein
MRSTRYLLLLLTLLWGLLPGALTAAGKPPAEDARVDVYFFWSAGCPHCLEARPFVSRLPEALPWLRVHDLEISRSRENARLYVAMAAELGEVASAVPGFLYCGELEVGWHAPETTGAHLRSRLEECRQRLLSGEPAAAPPDTVLLPGLGTLAPDAFSLPVFTLLVAGMDAFNPCAFFVLLFLLGLLANQRDRTRMLIIGGLFVTVSGVLYFAFMAAWLSLFRMIGSLGWVTVGAALLALAIGAVNVKDFFAFKRGVSLTIPTSRLPDIYRRGRAVLAAGSFPTMVGATLVLAVAANFYELLCTAGFPMVYTRVLTMHDLSPAGYYAYLALYNLIYVVPLLVIVLIVTFALGRTQLSERQGRLLKLMSGLMMGGLGLVLLVAPDRVHDLRVAFLLIVGAVAVTALAAYLEDRADRRAESGCRAEARSTDGEA